MHDVDETVRYRKKAKRKSVVKCGHKHVFVPCVVEYPKEWWQKEHLRSGEYIPTLASYCTICGRVGSHAYCGSVRLRPSEYTDTELTELNPETRTLPTFRCNDYFTKYVDLTLFG